MKTRNIICHIFNDGFDEFKRALQEHYDVFVTRSTKEINLITRDVKMTKSKGTSVSEFVYSGKDHKVNNFIKSIYPYVGFVGDTDDRDSVTVTMKESDLAKFGELFNVTVSDVTKFVYIGKDIRSEETSLFYSEKQNYPEYPIYIVSKGRYDCSLTAENLMMRGYFDFRIIIEEQEYENYNTFFPAENLLILPQKYKEEYEVLDNHGLTRSTGPGPARNFAWWHSKQEGHKYHWVLDDNIVHFGCKLNGVRRETLDMLPFAKAEYMVNCFDNIGIAGLEDKAFSLPPEIFTPNTRIYSCLLIRNDLYPEFKWRGRYNEDTILSLDVLTKGIATMNFREFYRSKCATQAVVGGNTGEFYGREGTLPKSGLLQDVYPEYSRIKFKIKRWHHIVDYTPFKGVSLGNMIEPAEPMSPILRLDMTQTKRRSINIARMGRYALDAPVNELPNEDFDANKARLIAYYENQEKNKRESTVVSLKQYKMSDHLAKEDYKKIFVTGNYPVNNRTRTSVMEQLAKVLPGNSIICNATESDIDETVAYYAYRNELPLVDIPRDFHSVESDEQYYQRAIFDKLDEYDAIYFLSNGVLPAALQRYTENEEFAKKLKVISIKAENTLF